MMRRLHSRIITTAAAAVTVASQLVARVHARDAASDNATQREPDTGSPFRLSLDTSYLYGPADGSLQTPDGGQPGASSPGRPTLDELGIDDVSLLDVELTLGWHAHEVYVGGQLVRMSGDATLEETLVSQNNTFPAGSQVESDVQLDWYRGGYRYRMDLDLDGDAARELTLAPAVGFALLDVDIQLDGSTGARVRRSYAKGSPQLGLHAGLRVTEWLTVEGEVLSSIPIEDAPFIVTATTGARFHILHDDAGRLLDVTFGVAYQRLQYDDAGKQELPNDIDVEFGPLLLIGIDARF